MRLLHSNFEEYVSIDDDIIASEPRSLEDIIEKHQNKNMSEESQGEPEIESIMPPSRFEALQAINLVRRHMQFEIESNENFLSQINGLENLIVSNNSQLKQKNSDYFD